MLCNIIIVTIFVIIIIIIIINVLLLLFVIIIIIIIVASGAPRASERRAAPSANARKPWRGTSRHERRIRAREHAGRGGRLPDAGPQLQEHLQVVGLVGEPSSFVLFVSYIICYMFLF